MSTDHLAHAECISSRLFDSSGALVGMLDDKVRARTVSCIRSTADSKQLRRLFITSACVWSLEANGTILFPKGRLDMTCSTEIRKVDTAVL